MRVIERSGLLAPDSYVREAGESNFALVELSLSDFDLPRPEVQRLNTKKLSRVVMRVSTDLLDQLDEIVKMLKSITKEDLSRAAVMRAALGMWLEIAKNADPAMVLEAVQKAHVPQGRKKSQ